MAESPSLSSRELKGLKKDELVRLILKMQGGETPIKENQQPVRRGTCDDTPVWSSQTVDSSQAKLIMSPMVAEIKNVVVDAVRELKQELRSEYMTLLKDIRNEFRQELENLRVELQRHEMKVNSSMRETEVEFLKDMHESELRKNNLMIFGLKESEVQSLDRRKQEDLKQIEILATEIGVSFAPPQNCIRLGKPGDKARPIKLIGLSSHTRESFLSYAPKINKLDEVHGFRKVFIKPDLSPKQQLCERLLRNELRSRREKGENVVIRNGKIINTDERLSSKRND